MGSGTYTVDWKNLSADQHTMKGQLTFTLALQESAATTATATPAGAQKTEQPQIAGTPATSAPSPTNGAMQESGTSWTMSFVRCYESPQSLSGMAPTLPPERFTGATRNAYQAAREIPQTLTQLPCYCRCDQSMGHKSLHSCFEDEHAASCAVCAGEALMAYRLQKQGLPPRRYEIKSSRNTQNNETWRGHRLDQRSDEK